MKRLRAHLTYSNVMVTVLAVLVIGGGTAYAATEMLPKNSVGSKQIKKEAVTPAKLSKSSKAALTGAAGAKGETGASGARGPQGEPGPKGDTGESGHVGEPGPFPNVLPSGKSLSGYLEVLSENTPVATESASFAFPLAAPPTSHFIDVGATTPAGCTGDSTDPGAEPGNLCIFVIEALDNVGPVGETGPTGDGTTDTRGFAVFARSAAAGLYFVKTRWVVTG